MKEYFKACGWIILSGAIMISLEMLGKGLGCFGWAKWALWCCIVMLAAVYAGSIRKLLHDSKNEVPDVAAEREEAVRRRQELERDSAPEKAAIEGLRRKIWLKWAGVIGLHALTGLFCGMSYEWAGIIDAVCMFTLAPLLAFGLCRPKMFMPAPGTELLPERFPLLFEMAGEIARESGHHRKLRIFLGQEGIGVFRGRDFDGMLLPPLLLRFMRRNELRPVMRHEFSHLVCKETEHEARWLLLVERMDCASESCGVASAGLIALMPEMRNFDERIKRYRTLIERKLETAADERSLSPGEARDAVAAIAKSGMFARFCDEDRVSAYRCFESEQPRKDMVNLRGEIFAQMLSERGEVWLNELESERQAQLDSHPTFRQRREAYGVTEYDAFSKETDPAWLAEMDRLCELENAFLAGNPDYQAQREHQYVGRRAAMETYENCADQLNELEPRKVVDAAEAYFGLNTPKAMQIVRSLLEKEPDNLEPKLLLGLWLLDARDDEGLALLYQVAENGNYTLRALEEIGNYVYRRGCEAQIEEYRRRSAELLQSAAEFHYHLDEIRLKDLKPRTMPDSLLDELASEMVQRGRGNIRTIACAAKPFQEGEDAHVFVLEYDGDDEERNEETNLRVFELLDRREENYALRDAQEMPLKKLERQVPGCIVYRKESQKKEDR